MATSLITHTTLMTPALASLIRPSSLVSLTQSVRMNQRNATTMTMSLCKMMTTTTSTPPSFSHPTTSRWSSSYRSSQYKSKSKSLIDEIEDSIHDNTTTNQTPRKLSFSEVFGERPEGRSRGGGRDMSRDGGRGDGGFRERGGRNEFRGKEGRSSSFAREFKVDRKSESFDMWSDRGNSRPRGGGGGGGGGNYNNHNNKGDFGYQGKNGGGHGRRSSSSSSSYDNEVEFEIPDAPSLPHPLAPRASILFEDLPLNQSLLSLLRGKGFTHPTPIQAAAIPPALEGKDIIAQAHTGTGKTVAFVLPILQHLAKKRTAKPDMDIDSALERFRVMSRGRNKPIEALIIAPTRELAVQIGQVFRMFGAHTSCAVGGQSPIPQLRDIERGGILVGTPGRLLDFHRGGKLNLNSVQHLVLDEVDRMLDMGFLPDIENICSAVSPKRQTMLFSATLPPSIQEIALRHSYEPLEINAVGDVKVVETVQQSVVMTRGEEKLNVLLDLLKWIFTEQGDARLLIFTNTKLYADRLTEVLNELGHPAHALHGDLRFHTRQMNLNSFKNGDVRILVATDVASRGLDIKGVTHVINFDVTNTPDDYVHRIGRTGRAGESGMAITLVASDKSMEKKRLSEIESMVGSRLPKFNKKLLQPAIETPIVL